MLRITPSNNQVSARQIAFFAAFVLPIYKLLETPSLLASFAQGDLLLPATLQFLAELAVLTAVLYACSRSEKTLLERLVNRFGAWVNVGYAVYCLFFFTLALLPLLDLEKFVYAVFYDTAPTLFSFAFFFVFAAFLMTKGLKTLLRLSDFSIFTFLIPFLVLIVAALQNTDFSTLLPFFEQDFQATRYAMNYTKPHFCDVAFLLPLLLNLRYQKRDGVKITLGYSLSIIFTLLFLAVFYALFSSIAPREHYAFAKIAQYHPILAVTGRIDLLFVYLLCVPLFVYVATPLLYSTQFTAAILHTEKTTPIAAIFAAAALLFVLFCNRHYDAIYAFFGQILFPIFYVLDFAPLLFLLLRTDVKEKTHA